MKEAGKLTAEQFKCPTCGLVPTSETSGFELVEPATAYRRLAFTVKEDGSIDQIETLDLSHDDGEGTRYVHHNTCNGEIEIPKAFWDYDIYG